MKNPINKITRRSFIKLTAAAGLIPGSLMKFARAADSSSNLSEATAKAIEQYPFVARYPYIPKSKVIHARHAGVWKGDDLKPEALRALLDASITEVVGVKNATDAWAALFKPNDRIAIKVNAFENSKIWTHAPLVYAVVDSLLDAGIPARQILIYDILCVFRDAGYYKDMRPGVRCIREKSLAGQVKLCETVENCDALINMPVLKSHMMAGMTFALKNHYGSISWPAGLHDGIDKSISEVNAMSEIKTRTRLVIGDILEANLSFRSYFPYWKPDYRGDSILMTYDPVAHDTVGLGILERIKTEKKQPFSYKNVALSYLEKSAQYGLGTHRMETIELSEIRLG